MWVGEVGAEEREELFGDERGDRVEEADGGEKEDDEEALFVSAQSWRSDFAEEDGLGEFEIGGAKIVPEKFVALSCRLVERVGGEGLCDVGDGAGEEREDPAIFELKKRGVETAREIGGGEMFKV
jgi:hypothetical protein